jgi:hypothetical protein
MGPLEASSAFVRRISAAFAIDKEVGKLRGDARHSEGQPKLLVRAGLVDFPGDRNARQPKHVRHFRLFQTRSVILKRQVLPLIAHAKLPQPVRIREPAQIVQLLVAQR